MLLLPNFCFFVLVSVLYVPKCIREKVIILSYLTKLYTLLFLLYLFFQSTVYFLPQEGARYKWMTGMALH